MEQDSLLQGHPYQGSFKSFPVESDEHLYTVWSSEIPGLPGWYSELQTGCGAAIGLGYIPMIVEHCHSVIGRYHDQPTGWILSTRH